MNPVRQTERGFSIITFTDANGEKCSIQQSSAIGNEPDAYDRPGSSMLWLGVDDPTPKVLGPVGTGWVDVPLPEGTLLGGRMHLNRSQVRELVAKLQGWLDTGCLE